MGIFRKGSLRRAVTLFCLAVPLVWGTAAWGGAESFRGAPAEGSSPSVSFDEFLGKHENLTAEGFFGALPHRNHLEALPFDPTEADFFERASGELDLTGEELAIYRKLGFVSVDHDQRYGFAALYGAIYHRDLPVLITTDSILHVVHRLYDELLAELETLYFAFVIDELLSRCHEELGSLGEDDLPPALMESLEDVDLYLTVARNLLLGAGDRGFGDKPLWDGKLIVKSITGQDARSREILHLVEAMEMPKLTDPCIEIYGGCRQIDFSQFRPRGHYARAGFSSRIELQRYFRAMMWLGRPDTGWNVLPADPGAVFRGDPGRELRSAVLLTELMVQTDTLGRLESLSEMLDFMIGPGDNITPFLLAEKMGGAGVTTVLDLLDGERMNRLRTDLRDAGAAAQRIRSQFVHSNPETPRQVAPPPLFQLFGQRYAVDSFVLASVVFDAILYRNRKVERMMPKGLDVMASLGSDEAALLLEDELARYPYAANLAAARDYVHALPAGFWESSLYNVWLNALRLIDDNHFSLPNFPSVMKTRAWQRKQLQAQLASWAELRRDNVLYAKQSFTGGAVCEYPYGYVEPYPELYAALASFAKKAVQLVEEANYETGLNTLKWRLGETRDELKERQLVFLRNLVDTMHRLGTLADKELDGIPFSSEEAKWLKQTIFEVPTDVCGIRAFDGWYAKLIYDGRAGEPQWKKNFWDPVIADVHSDPNDGTVLEVATGDAHFLVAAIDSERDLRTYVGPVYSYYEFTRPASGRLSDDEWQGNFYKSDGTIPERPAWTKLFRAAPVKREHIGILKVQDPSPPTPR